MFIAEIMPAIFSRIGNACSESVLHAFPVVTYDSSIVTQAIVEWAKSLAAYREIQLLESRSSC
jgi:hypothetical protein